jgi:hypothetical protein
VPNDSLSYGPNWGFAWIPLTQPDSDTIERMRKHFARPREPMRVPWFLGEIRYHNSVMDEPLETLDAKSLISLLEDIASGISSHGRWDEWVGWFQYALPTAILRGHEGGWELILGNTLTAFFNVYWNGIEEEYPGFRDDILNSLAKSIMMPAFWDEKGDFKITEMELNSKAYFYESIGTFSAAMFFCLKYLKNAEIVSWVASITSIASPRWKIQLMLWLINAKNFYKIDDDGSIGRILTEQLREANLGWGSDIYLMRIEKSIYEFTSKVNVDLFWSEIIKTFRLEFFLNWIETLHQDPTTAQEISVTGLPDLFFDRFFSE